jgi:CBS domain-containing protein
VKVHQIMSYPVVKVAQDTPLREVARIMLAEQIGAVPIVDDDGRLCGIVTESDFAGRERYLSFSAVRLAEVFGELIGDDGVETVYRDARSHPAAEVMSSPVVTISEDAPIGALVKLMLERNIRHVPVERDRMPVGMVTRRDLLRLMVDD